MEKLFEKKIVIYFIILGLGIIIAFLIITLKGIHTDNSFNTGEGLGTVSVTTVPQKAVKEGIVTENQYDKYVIPDKYNTGVKAENLSKVKVGKNDKLTYVESGGYLALSYSQNSHLSGEVRVSNMDFSEFAVRTYNWEKQSKKLVIIFDNCKFKHFRSFEQGDLSVEFVFQNCSFEHCAGSNIKLINCYFTGGVIDSMNFYNNCYVIGCFIEDKSFKKLDSPSGIHTDGIQIFGSEQHGCSNIHFENCRFEMPILMNSANAVNAPIMLQMEFSDANNISFERCYVNGGGYSIYALVKNDNCHIYDSRLKNIKVGCASRWGALYPNVSEEILIEDINYSDSLYVGSVFEYLGEVYICVSNDTEENRIIEVCTNTGRQIHFIPACYRYELLTEDIEYSDYPFDLLLNLGRDVEWVVCYDATDEKNKQQIRYVNFSSEAVYLN